MTDHDSIELGRRAVASKHWRWMPGMRYCEPCRVPSWSGEPRFLRMVDGHEKPSAEVEAQYSGCVPDLRDPATLGCLLQLVREAWGDPGIVPTWRENDACIDFATIWTVRGHCGQTEAEALVAALLAAPE